MAIGGIRTWISLEGLEGEEQYHEVKGSRCWVSEKQKNEIECRECHGSFLGLNYARGEKNHTRGSDSKKWCASGGLRGASE